MNMPKVSVIIPCYNTEKYLKQCLDSVTSQTLQDIEIICVDDGSTDNTLNILRQYEKADHRIRILRQQNKFAGVARNAGMEIAKGEYFAFLDADDYYEPDGLEKAYAIAKENNLDMLKLSSYLLDDCTGELTTNTHYSHGNFVQKNQILVFNDAPNNLLNCADVAWNGLYSSEFIHKNQIRFNSFRCVNDRSFYISCLVHAQRIMVADEYLTTYRRNIAGSLVSVRYKFFDCQINSYKLIKSIVSGADIPSWPKTLTMRHELNQVFIWYEKFLESGVNTFGVEKIIRDFIAEYDISDIGEDYLAKFQRKQYFDRFRESLQIRYEQGAVSDTPMVSVIVPVHNSVRYLSECIESILLQTLRDFEIICINDASTDASREILECFAALDRRIRIIDQQPAGGAGMVRNLAIQAATGKYMVFVDSDDKIQKDFLQTLCAAAESNQAEVVVTQRISWNGRGAGYPMRNWIANKKLPKGQVFSVEDVPDYILNFTDGAPGGKLFRSDFILENNIQYLTIRRSEDFHFIFSAFLLAKRILCLDTFGYFYRKNNPTSLESTKDETPLLFWDATLIFRDKLIQMGIYDQIERSYLNNTINRVAFNLKAVNTFDGFCAIFTLLKQIHSSQLQLDAHDRIYFYDTSSYDYLMQVLQFDTPEAFLHHSCKRQMEELTKLRRRKTDSEELAKLRNSVSFRLGRLLTYVPRKIRGFFLCIRDHGLKYTIRYTSKKVLNKLHPKQT